MKLLLLGVVLCMYLYAVQCESVDDNDPEEEEEWRVFKADRARKYSPQEDAIRRKYFSSNRKLVKAHNEEFKKGKQMFRLRLNRLSDKSQDEINRKKGHKREKSIPKSLIWEPKHRVGRQTLPERFDWRTKGKVTPVKDQSSCGSCYSFAALGALESHIAIKGGNLTNLAEQEVIDCSGNLGCDGGNAALVFEYVLSAGGLTEESAYPYMKLKGTCKDISAFPKYGKLTSYKYMSPLNEGQMKANIVNIGPLYVSINSSWQSFTLYAGGIYSQTGCNPENTDHAVLVVGYGVSTTGVPFWIIKNSWNTWWGENGYMRMVRNKNMCGIAERPVFPILSA